MAERKCTLAAVVTEFGIGWVRLTIAATNFQDRQEIIVPQKEPDLSFGQQVHVVVEAVD